MPKTQVMKDYRFSFGGGDGFGVCFSVHSAKGVGNAVTLARQVLFAIVDGIDACETDNASDVRVYLGVVPSREEILRSIVAEEAVS
jgi:hypothetical protein